jgi:hypothetical protein
MVNVNNLEVRFDVEGEGDDAAFARLFEKHIKQWSRQAEEAKEREHRARDERAVGDRQEV